MNTTLILGSPLKFTITISRAAHICDTGIAIDIRQLSQEQSNIP
jgi:hypothetical protein